MNGEFEIKGLDEKLLFNILVFVKGYRAQITPNVDPDNGKVSISLDPVARPDELPEKCQMSGNVVDHNGKPILGARVYIKGATQGKRKWGGRVRQVDKVVTTDENGNFFLTADAEFDAWQLSVYAAGFVRTLTDHLPTGKQVHQIKMDPGTLVTGVVRDGEKPVAGLLIGICQKDRTYPDWVGEYQICTDQNGLFTFTSVVPEDTFFVYAKMDGELKAHTIEIAEFETPESGGKKELGEFELLPTSTVSGQVVLTDGAKFETGEKLYLGRKFAWGTQVVELAEDGKFVVENVPAGVIEIRLQIDGYRFANENPYQRSGENGIVKLVKDNVEGMKIRLEPIPDNTK